MCVGSRSQELGLLRKGELGSRQTVYTTYFGFRERCVGTSVGTTVGRSLKDNRYPISRWRIVLTLPVYPRPTTVGCQVDSDEKGGVRSVIGNVV